MHDFVGDLLPRPARARPAPSPRTPRRGRATAVRPCRRRSASTSPDTLRLPRHSCTGAGGRQRRRSQPARRWATCCGCARPSNRRRVERRHHEDVASRPRASAGIVCLSMAALTADQQGSLVLSVHSDASTCGLFDAAGPAVTHRLDMHRLDVDELADAESRAFAAVARMLDPAERQARVGADIVVDEADAGLELLGGDPSAAVQVGGQDPRARPNSLALAMRIASASSSAAMIAATGPNTSSSWAGWPGRTSVSTVAGYQAPGRSGTWPPSSSRAPLAMLCSPGGGSRRAP